MGKSERIKDIITVGIISVVFVPIITISIYRAVINSDWYADNQTKKSFLEMSKNINNHENIDYIKIDIDFGENGFREEVVYNVPQELFDDISCDDYTAISDTEIQTEIFSNPCIAVFYKDKTYDVFFLNNNGELFWGTSLKVECESLKHWVEQQNIDDY